MGTYGTEMKDNEEDNEEDEDKDDAEGTIYLC